MVEYTINPLIYQYIGFKLIQLFEILVEVCLSVIGEIGRVRVKEYGDFKEKGFILCLD